MALLNLNANEHVDCCFDLYSYVGIATACIYWMYSYS